MSQGYLTCEVSRAPRWDTFLAGLVINFAAILLLIGARPNLTTVDLREPLVAGKYTMLVAPRAESRRRPAPTPVARLKAPKIPPRMGARPPQPKDIEAPKPQVQPEVAKAAPPVKPAVPEKLAPVPETKPETKQNTFASAPAAESTLKKPAREVQTGGFGDPAGASTEDAARRQTVTMARLGAFDLPNGPGQGNGAGGSRGTAGRVQSSGFMSAPVATAANSGRTVTPSGFGDAATAAEAKAPAAPKKPEVQPLQILFKPRPAYTPEARRQRVEGEVLLDVTFTASGSLHINRVVKGLGYGLDDMAQEAAQRIQFRPALRNGQPYDCVALVHMTFELTN